MNLVYNKKNLRIISIFDHKITADNQTVLKSMFPENFQDLSLWSIDKNIEYPIMNLTIKLDQEGNPKSILYKNKIVYTATIENEEKSKQLKEKQKEDIIAQFIPRNLRSSFGSDILKVWTSSTYTKPDIAKSLKNLDYFSQKVTPVLWWGCFLDAGGYGNMNRSIVFRLHNHHFITKTEVMPTPPQISTIGQYYVSKHSSLDFRRIKHYPRICGFSPHPHPPHKGRQVFYTMMETETLHPIFRDLCNNHSDEIWVPSAHNKRMFLEGGVKKEILVMPLGVDETIYKNVERIDAKDLNKLPVSGVLGKTVSQGINKFRFFSLFGWSYRKGVDILVKSFVKAFTAQDDVVLIMYSHHVGPGTAVQDVIRYAAEVRSSNYPQILFIHTVTPELEMPSLYKVGHVFVNCSRGEGYSLPQIEAAACGLPVISCNNTGMSEYLTDDNSFMITTDEKEICSPEMHWISGFYHGQLFPKLGENQINQTVNHMRYVVNNYEKAKEKGKILQEQVYQKYTWDKVTERVSDRIRYIS